LRVSIRKNETDAKLILSGFIYPAKAKYQQGLNISGSYEPDIQYGLFNPDHAYLGPNAFETTIPLQELRSDETLSISSGSIPWHQSCRIPYFFCVKTMP
jgi:hypothetical protein